MSKEVTPIQATIVREIRAFITANGFVPSIRELTRLMGKTSTNGMVEHLSRLEAKGYVQRSTMTARSLVLTDKPLPDDPPPDATKVEPLAPADPKPELVVGGIEFTLLAHYEGVQIWGHRGVEIREWIGSNGRRYVAGCTETACYGEVRKRPETALASFLERQAEWTRTRQITDWARGRFVTE